MPVSTAVSVTFAAGTTASDASRTVPTTLAVSNCADAFPAAITHTHTARTRARIAHTSLGSCLNCQGRRLSDADSTPSAGPTPSRPRIGSFGHEGHARSIAGGGAAAAGLFLQVLLHAELGLVRGAQRALVGAVRTKIPGLDVVAERRAQRLEDAALVRGVVDREHQLDPPIQVAAHPVGAGEIHLLLAAV